MLIDTITEIHVGSLDKIEVRDYVAVTAAHSTHVATVASCLVNL